MPKLGEERSLTLGLAIYAAAFALFGLASRGWMMYPIVMFFSLAGITMPALQSILARHVPADHQGELLGSLVSLGSVAAILAPLYFTKLFVTFTRSSAPVYFPGAAYLGASAVCLLTLAIRFSRRSAGAASTEPAAAADGPPTLEPVES